MNLAALALSALFVLPALAASSVARLPAPAAREASAYFAGACLLCSLTAWLLHATFDHPWFVLDALNAPVLCLVTVITLAIIVAGPKRTLGARSLSYLFWTALTIDASLVLVRPWTVALALLLGLVPAYLTIRAQADEPRRVARSFAIFVSSGTLLLACALVLLEIPGMSALSALGSTEGAQDASALHTHAGFHPLQLLWLGVLMRMAVVPMHSWLLVMFEKGPLGITLLLLCANPGAYLIARLGLPYATEGFIGLELLANIALVTALYSAFLTLAQRDLRRLVGFVALSQSGLILVGLGSRSTAGVAGALTHWTATSLALTGLALCAWAVQARAATTDMDRLSGMSLRAPGLAGLFAAFALASVGVPGSLTFVSQDLLAHGVHPHFPHVATAIVLATALNAAALLRAYVKIFLGPASQSSAPYPLDLLPRERLALCLLLSCLVLLGMFPNLLVHTPPRSLTAACPSATHRMELSDFAIDGACRRKASTHAAADDARTARLMRRAKTSAW
jgi:NADH-quinone oxidoreductase subunit M